MKYLLAEEYCIKKTMLGDIYLFNNKTGDIYDLNETAAFILENIHNKNIPEIISIAKQKFDIDDFNLFEEELKNAIKEYVSMKIIFVNE